MKGELCEVWSETWREIWSKLAKQDDLGREALADIFRDVVPSPVAPERPDLRGELSEAGEPLDAHDVPLMDGYKTALSKYRLELAQYESAVSEGAIGGKYFTKQVGLRVADEQSAVNTLERAYAVVGAFESDALSNHFFVLVERFIEKYSLRYDLRRPFSLHPTLPGIFASLIADLKKLVKSDAHLSALLHDFEEALRDIRQDDASGKIKTCMQKQVSLLEALAKQYPTVNQNTLGAMCNEIDSWPHVTLREALKKLYGFASDYPGIRHSGNPESAIREIEMRDMIAVSVVLAGFVPYLTNVLDANKTFHGEAMVP